MSRNRQLFIALDIGSSSIKGGLFEAQGTLLRSYNTPLTTVRGHGEWHGYVEFDPSHMLAECESILSACMAEASSLGASQVQLALSGQRSSIVMWDHDGPLMAGISWQDLRTIEWVTRHAAENGWIAQRSGLMLNAHYGASKLRWSLDHCRDVQQAAHHRRLFWGSVNCYLIWWLTGGQVYAMDHVQAQRTLLMNISGLEWDRKLFTFFGLDWDLKATLHATAAEYGMARHWTLPLSIVYSTGDAQASMLHYAGRDRPTLCMQFGTGGFVAALGLHSPKPVPRLLLSLLQSRSRPKGDYDCEYMVEGTINSVGALYDWLDDHPEPEFQQMASDTSFLLPSLNGLGAPHWIGAATPIVYGPDHKGSLRDAANRGLAARVHDILQQMACHGLQLAQFAELGGGMSAEDTFVQSVADQTGCCLRVSEEQCYHALYGLAKAVGLPVAPSASVRDIRPAEDKRRSNVHWWHIVRDYRQMKMNRHLHQSLWRERLCRGWPLMLAHRGLSASEPENTMAAFQSAIEAGADGFECDIRLTREGHPIIMHDRTLDRTTNGRGDVGERSLEELKKLDAGSWFHPERQGERVPALHDLFDLAGEPLLLLELKDEESDMRLWSAVWKAVQEQGVAARTMLCSMNHAMALTFKREHSSALVGAVVSRRHKTLMTRMRKSASGSGWSLLPELDALSFQHDYCDQLNLAASVWSGQLLMAWTVDDEQRVAQLAKKGIDSVISNGLTQRPANSGS